MTVDLKCWQSLTVAEQADVRAIEVTSEQVEFAGTVERSIQACHEAPSDEVTGLAILRASRIVGFLVMKRGASAPNWAAPGTAIVSAMRIDRSCQGQGVGSAALRALPEWLNNAWPESREVALAVDEENHLARRAYARAGFIDSGRRDEGRIGWVRYLSKSIDNNHD